MADLIRAEIIRARARLLLRHPFFGYLALGLEPTEDLMGTSTMQTDGIRLFYNPGFVKRLPAAELETVIAHEVLHCVLGHIWRRGGRELVRWKHATDYAVNSFLASQGFEIPAGGLCDEQFSGMAAERIYALLPDLGVRGRLLDSQGRRPRAGVKPGASGPMQRGGRDLDLERRWKERAALAANAARMCGNLPEPLDEFVRDLLEPKLDWRVTLKGAMLLLLAKSDFRLVPPNKRHIWRGIYLPTSTLGGESWEIAVAVDTSVSDRECQEFLAEVRAIAEQLGDCTLHLFFCGTAIHARFSVGPYDEWPRVFPKRGGGTSFTPVFDAISRDGLPVTGLVYLTDGDGKYPEYPPDYPVIWVLTSDYRVPWGESIRLEGKDYLCG